MRGNGAVHRVGDAPEQAGLDGSGEHAHDAVAERFVGVLGLRPVVEGDPSIGVQNDLEVETLFRLPSVHDERRVVDEEGDDHAIGQVGDARCRGYVLYNALMVGAIEEVEHLRHRAEPLRPVSLGIGSPKEINPSRV